MIQGDENGKKQVMDLTIYSLRQKIQDSVIVTAIHNSSLLFTVKVKRVQLF